MRYGSCVAKTGIAPSSENLREVTGKAIDLSADYNALEKLIKHLFRRETAVWDVKAQLALAPADPNAETKDMDFPIERLTSPGQSAKSRGKREGQSPPAR